MIKEFERLLYKGYALKNPKNEITDSSFFLARQIAKCTMKAYSFNFHVDPVRSEINGTQHIMILHVCSLEKRE